MNVFIRVDASIDIGIGHVMRCLTLAQKLREQGNMVSFICREHTGHLCDFIEINGYKVLRLPASQVNLKITNYTKHSKWLGVPLSVDATQTKNLLRKGFVDLLIVDHYAINEVWEGSLREVVNKILIIDDLADRKHDCDVLIDQNYFEDYPIRYHSLVPPHCKTFLGPSYVLLRDEFYDQWSEQEIRSGAVKRILIFFGGIDHTNETGKALATFLKMNRNDIQVDVVVGRNNLHKRKLASICKQYNFLHFYCQVANISELMRQADLSIGAGGTTTWERCFLSLPSIVWSIADNQVEICKTLSRKKIIKYLGEKETLEQTFLTQQLENLIENEVERNEMSRLSYLLMKDNIVKHQSMIQQIMRLEE
ncbi:UDP-2,4-diacetamido-2,4,6-trideoxy-beta-L-altropyranose hydrolase [Peribacillus muralis]|uniref:UDP-2,4-diacetamido-2,4, 6-trideoxy-beta-L-altropyranose hydrolase n=1 Tax=Peribacillus muralis TaxID=264697 RepID=UPI00070D3966|nr:UDP-2,4-diacetamido-2,4,6-trideoxy-beta-L-altropyranose hydrolase [Peribacillus muralis]